MNYYTHFLVTLSQLEYLRDNVEKQILTYIHDEWNKDLSVCVECKDYNIEVTVMENIDYERFEFFIINKICEKFDLKVSYKELVTCENDNGNYCEWGLYRE